MMLLLALGLFVVRHADTTPLRKHQVARDPLARRVNARVFGASTWLGPSWAQRGAKAMAHHGPWEGPSLGPS
jgi:hypothetical protein